MCMSPQRVQTQNTDAGVTLMYSALGDEVLSEQAYHDRCTCWSGGGCAWVGRSIFVKPLYLPLNLAWT